MSDTRKAANFPRRSGAGLIRWCCSMKSRKRTLSKPDLLKIVDLEVDKVKRRLKLKEIEIVLDEPAHEFVINKGYDPTYGARPMRRAVERYLEDPLAEELLKGTVKAGDIVEVTVEGDKLAFRAAEPHASTAASAS